MLSKGEKLVSAIDDLVYEKTQAHEYRVDLTVAEIYEIKGKGSLDFGGSEFEESRLKKIEPKKRHPDDDYGWWEMKGGTYIIKFNETLIEGKALVQPIPRLLKTGSTIPTFIHEEGEELRSLLKVCDEGVNIKENARVAGMYKID
ncbi:MAG: dCTP deaminase [Thermoplasmatota archaeon]